jgi:hypothetical protein
LGFRADVLLLTPILAVNKTWRGVAGSRIIGKGSVCRGYRYYNRTERQGAECRVQGAGFRVQGSELRVQGAGLRVQGPGCRN